MNNIEVSIIMPIYNAEKYLDITINSVLQQTFNNFELILVNDGSKDKSGEICEKFKALDSRVKVIHSINRGVSAARNLGIKSSLGKYLLFIDSDDYAEENWCNDLYNFIIKNEDALIISGYRKIVNNNKFNFLYEKDLAYSKINNSEFLSVFEKSLFNNPFNKIFNSSIIKNNNIYFNEKISLGEDMLFVLDYMKYTNSQIILVNEILYNYIIRDLSGLDNKYYKDLFERYNYIYNRLNDDLDYFKVNTLQKKIFFESYLNMLIRVLNNSFRKECEMTFIQKVNYNKSILESECFQMCLMNIPKSIKKNILYTNNYILIHFYCITLRNIKYFLKKIKNSAFLDRKIKFGPKPIFWTPKN